MRRILFALVVLTGIFTPIAAHAALVTFPCTGSDGNPTSATYTVTDGTLTSIRDCYGALTLDASVTRINYATSFSYVTSITIPSTTTTIEQDPFMGPLTSITVATGNTHYKSDASGVLYTYDGLTLVQYPEAAPGTTYSIPTGTTTIGGCAFSQVQNLQFVTVPASVTSMDGGFQNCSYPSTSSLQAINVESANATYSSLDGVLFNKTQTSLVQYPIGKTNTSYTVPSSVTAIVGGAFALNTFDANVIIPTGLLSIGTYAFESNTGLTSITIPASVSTFGDYPFVGDSKLTAINVDPTNTILKSVSGVLYSKDGTRLIEYPDGKTDTNFVIPTGVITLEVQWIWTNPSLLNITVPSTVTTIGAGYTQSRGSNQSYLIFSGNSSVTSISGSYAKTVIYCGTTSSVISTYAVSNGSAAKCESAAPAFTSSKATESLEIGNSISGYSITASVTPDGYSISPAVSNNLSFNDSTGLISGTPSSAASPIIYTITGYNAFGSASVTYALTVTPVPVPDPVQQSKISGITPTTGVAGTPVTVTASGNFVEKISAIQIDGIGIAVGSWTQTPTSVTFTIPTKSAGSYSVQIYNGSAPVLAEQRFTVTAVPIPASLNPVPKQKVIYISCAKPGHGTRIAYGVNPTCPAGYVKK